MVIGEDLRSDYWNNGAETDQQVVQHTDCKEIVRRAEVYVNYGLSLPDTTNISFLQLL